MAHHHQRPSKSFIVQQQLLSPASRLETFIRVRQYILCLHASTRQKKKQIGRIALNFFEQEQHIELLSANVVHRPRSSTTKAPIIGQQTKKNVYELIIFAFIKKNARIDIYIYIYIPTTTKIKNRHFLGRIEKRKTLFGRKNFK